jgi:hypothetical protein
MGPKLLCAIIYKFHGANKYFVIESNKILWDLLIQNTITYIQCKTFHIYNLDKIWLQIINCWSKLDELF